MRVTDPQAMRLPLGRGGGGPDLSFLYFLFCIIENLGDLTNIPNSIFCKFSILEHSCAQQGVCSFVLYVRRCVYWCVCVCVYAVELLSYRTPVSLIQMWQFWVFPGPARAVSTSFWGTILSGSRGRCMDIPPSISLSLQHTNTHISSPK